MYVRIAGARYSDRAVATSVRAVSSNPAMRAETEKEINLIDESLNLPVRKTAFFRQFMRNKGNI